MQSIFDLASEWINSRRATIRVWSVNTVPIVGSNTTTDALFKHSLNQSVYEATLRTKPENAVSVVNIVRVVYSSTS